MHLLGVLVSGEGFYERAVEGARVEVDVPSRTVTVHDASGAATFPFSLTTMEERFLQAGGVEKLYKTFRKELFKALVKGPSVPRAGAAAGCGDDDCGSALPAETASGKLAW
jgi:hypothetical protein